MQFVVTLLFGRAVKCTGLLRLLLLGLGFGLISWMLFHGWLSNGPLIVVVPVLRSGPRVI